MKDENALLPRSINAFGAALFGRLSSTDESSFTSPAVLVSPWGVAHALAMLLEGAEPGCAAHNQLIETVFGVGVTSDNREENSNDVRSLSQHVAALAASIIEVQDGNELTIVDANSAWVAPTTRLQPQFMESLRTLFRAQASTLTGAKAVNDWVNEATRGKIASIIDEGTARQAALVLVNAIYFKGLWETPFEKRSTRPLPFHLLDGTRQQTPHMWMKVKRGTAVQGATLKAALPKNGGTVECMLAKLKYKGAAFSAIVAAPVGAASEAPVNGRLTLEGGVDYAEALHACRSAVLAQLSGDGVVRWLSVGDPGVTAIELFLPRFEVEAYASLTEPLRAIGLNAMFGPGQFTRIAVGSPDLMVSEVAHKVYIKVDEEGTTAAAVTAVMMMRAAMIRPPELFMKFDKPFVFCVVHEETGLVLFAGDIHRPEVAPPIF